jgi:predicted neuraminidase
LRAVRKGVGGVERRSGGGDGAAQVGPGAPTQVGIVLQLIRPSCLGAVFVGSARIDSGSQTIYPCNVNMSLNVGAVVVAALAASMVCASAQSVIASGAKLETLSSDFSFTEGPTCDSSGNIFFTDQTHQNKTMNTEQLSCLGHMMLAVRRPVLWLVSLGAVSLTTVNLSAAQSGLLTAEYVFESAPFPECHASTIVETKEGLIAAWFGGKHEKSPDVGIWLSSHINGQWTPPVEVANGVQHLAKRYPCWNPVLFQPRQGPLMLFYKVGPDPKRWWGMLMTSSDDGKHWSEPRRLPEDILGPVKNKPVQLANGDILCGSSTEYAGLQVHFERTADFGKTWEITRPINQPNEIEAIQPSILVYSDHRLQAVGRTEQGRIFETWSQDNGKTWDKMTLTGLPNPDSGIDAVTLQDGRQLLVYNHTAKGRSPLNIAVSADGKHWQAALTLEDHAGMEFSYPAVIQTRDGLVHVVYTWDRKRIKHVVVEPGKLELKPMENGKWPK